MKVSFAIISGCCAAFASFFGKLSGLNINIFNSQLDYVFNIICLGLMVILNGVMWTFFIKALQVSNSSLNTTMLSSATNYVISGILGLLVFSEVTGLLWWTGISLILVGITLISSNESLRKNE